MFFSAAAVAVVLSAFSGVLATGPGEITLPANGSNIAPGEAFRFSYIGAGDYCRSSYNTTITLYTTKPGAFADTTNYAQGYVYGTYSGSLPSTLTMPNFSKGFGGFGTGKNATNAPVYLTVSESYQECGGSFGAIFNLHYITLNYNSTGAAAPTKYQINPNGDKSQCVQFQGLFPNAQVYIGGCNPNDGNFFYLKRGQTTILTGANQGFSLDAGSKPGNSSPLFIEPKQSSNSSQNWYYTDDNRIALTNQGLCLDLPNGNKNGGTRLQLYKCITGNTNQIWTLNAIPQ